MAYLRTITGPMFSEKTKTLRKHIKTAIDNRGSIVVAQPKENNRKERNIFSDLSAQYEKDGTYSHLATGFIESAEELRELMDMAGPHHYPKLLAIDEAHLFYPGDWLFDFIVTELMEKNVEIDIIICGLATDFQKRPFNQMPNFMAIANHNITLHTRCSKCGGIANLTYRKTEFNKKQILIGNEDIYEPRCWGCHDLPYK